MDLLRHLVARVRCHSLAGAASDPFVPESELESFLAAHVRGQREGSLDRVLEALPAARLFVPSRQIESELEETAGFRPVVLRRDGHDCVVALTARSRLRGLLPLVPDVSSGLDVDGSWVVAQCRSGAPLGLVLNPGEGVGLAIPARELERVEARDAGGRPGARSAR